MSYASCVTVSTPIVLVSGDTTTGYLTMADAVAAAQSGDTIKLLANVTDQLSVPASKSITLDLNGKTLDYADGHTIVVSKKNAALTITGAGTIKDSGNKSVSVGASTASVTFDANFTGTVESLNVSSGTVTVNNGTFKDDVTAYLADDKTVVKQGDYYAVQAITLDNAVFAVINGDTTQLFTVQQKATAAWVAANGSTLKLLKPATLATTIDIDVDYNLTLDLNGQAWSMGGWQQGIRLNKGNLTVTGAGSMLYTQESGSCETFKTAAGTTLTLKNGSFDRVTANGNFVFEAGTLKDLSMFSAPNGTTATLSGGSITGQFTLPYTTGIAVTVSGGSIANMTCQNDDATGGTTVTVTGGTIGWLQNAGVNTISGGTVENLKWGENTITGGKFTHLYYDVNDGTDAETYPYYGVTKNHISGGLFASNVYEGDPGDPARTITADCVNGYAMGENTDDETKGAYPYAVEKGTVIADVKAAQRFPWNGLVDITFTLKTKSTVKLHVAAYDGNTRLTMTKEKVNRVTKDAEGKTVEATADVTGGLVVEACETTAFHFVWDSTEAVPNAKKDGITFKVFAISAQ